MERIRDGLATGSGIIPLALARGQAEALGAQLFVEPGQLLSTAGTGTKIELLLPPAGQ